MDVNKILATEIEFQQRWWEMMKPERIVGPGLNF